CVLPCHALPGHFRSPPEWTEREPAEIFWQRRITCTRDCGRPRDANVVRHVDGACFEERQQRRLEDHSVRPGAAVDRLIVCQWDTCFADVHPKIRTKSRCCDVGAI